MTQAIASSKLKYVRLFIAAINAIAACLFIYFIATGIMKWLDNSKLQHVADPTSWEGFVQKSVAHKVLLAAYLDCERYHAECIVTLKEYASIKGIAGEFDAVTNDIESRLAEIRKNNADIGKQKEAETNKIIFNLMICFLVSFSMAAIRDKFFLEKASAHNLEIHTRQ